MTEIKSGRSVDDLRYPPMETCRTRKMARSSENDVNTLIDLFDLKVGDPVPHNVALTPSDPLLVPF